MNTKHRTLRYNVTDSQSKTLPVSKPHNSSATNTPTSYSRRGSSSTSAKVSPMRSLPRTPTKNTGMHRREDGPAEHKEALLEGDFRSGYDRTSPPLQNGNHTERHYVDVQAMIEECLKTCRFAILETLELQMKEIQRMCISRLDLKGKSICTVKSHAQLFEKELQQDNIIKDLRGQNQELLGNIAELEHRYNNLEQRSTELTKQMAWKTECSETLENVNDELSNSNITKRLKRLYNNDWANLYRLLSRSLPRETSELEKILLLSNLIKLSYDECSELGDRYLRTLFCLKEKELLPVRSNELMAPLRRICQSQFVRERIIEKVLHTLLATDESKRLHHEDNTNDVNRRFYQKFCDFFSELIDCLWLVATISSPPMILNFEVVGKRFTTVQNSWTQYTTKKPVVDFRQDEGTIVLVVWPSVERKGQQMFYIKGDAVVVTTGRNSINVVESARLSARFSRHNRSTHDPHEMNANAGQHTFV